MTVGLCSRTLSTSSNGEWTSHPQLKIIALALYWDQWETSYGVYNYGSLAEGSTTGSIAHAHTNGYKLGIRWFQGRDTPLSAWMGTSYPTGTAANNFKPVNPIAYLSNESSEMYPARAAGTLSEFIPDISTTTSAENYRYHRARGLTELARWLNTNCPKDATHKISTHVHWIAMGGHENGTEFSINYHRYQPTYQGAATLENNSSPGAGIGTSATVFKLNGVVTGYPTSGGLWRIVETGEQADGGKTERIHVASFNPTGNVVTVAKRGHSGDDAKNHAFGVQVQWAPLATAGAPQGAELAAYAGYPVSGTAPFDVYHTCQRALFNVTSGATASAKNTALIAAYKQDWIYILTDYMAYLPSVTRGFLAGSNLFDDNGASARNVIQTYGPTYKSRLYVGVTNFNIGGASKTYASVSPNLAAFLSDGVTAGNLVGVQLQGTGGLPNLGTGTQVTSNKQDIINACEHAITAYGARFVEMQSTRYDQTANTVATTTIGGWTAKSVNQQQYLLTDSNTINGRFTEPPSTSLTPTGISSTAAVGTPTLSMGVALTITVTARTTTLTVGTPIIFVQPGIPLRSIAIAPTTSFGTPTVAVAKVITTTGIAASTVVGRPVVHISGTKTLVAVGIGSTLSFGTATIAVASAHALAALGRASTLFFGTATIALGTGLRPSGIASTLSVGTPLVVRQVAGAKTIRPDAIGPDTVFGEPSVSLPPDDDDGDTLQPYVHRFGGGVLKTPEEMERTGVSIGGR